MPTRVRTGALAGIDGVEVTAEVDLSDYYLTDATEVARQVAGWMADILGWDQARQEVELARYGKQE